MYGPSMNTCMSMHVRICAQVNYRRGCTRVFHEVCKLLTQMCVWCMLLTPCHDEQGPLFWQCVCGYVYICSRVWYDKNFHDTHTRCIHVCTLGFLNADVLRCECMCARACVSVCVSACTCVYTLQGMSREILMCSWWVLQMWISRACLCACACARDIDIYIHTHTHILLHMHIYYTYHVTDIYTRKHACIHIDIHIHILTYNTVQYKHTIHQCIQSHTHVYIYTYLHLHAHVAYEHWRQTAHYTTYSIITLYWLYQTLKNDIVLSQTSSMTGSLSEQKPLFVGLYWNRTLSF